LCGRDTTIRLGAKRRVRVLATACGTLTRLAVLADLSRERER
jgi:hypothetical protein